MLMESREAEARMWDRAHPPYGFARPAARCEPHVLASGRRAEFAPAEPFGPRRPPSPRRPIFSTGGREERLARSRRPRPAPDCRIQEWAEDSIDAQAQISKEIHLPEPEMPRDFLRAKRIFARQPGPPECGVAGQAGREDDGSLARGCAAPGARYVDVEAAHGKPDKPTEMNGWLGATLL